MRRRPTRLRVAGAVLAVIAIAGGAYVATDQRSPFDQRMHDLAAAATRIPDCNGGEVHDVHSPRSLHAPGMVATRVISCGPLDNLGPGLVVDTFRTPAAVAAAVRWKRSHNPYRVGLELCTTRTELFDLDFPPPDGGSPKAFAKEQQNDRAFCRSVGAAAPTFTGEPAT